MALFTPLVWAWAVVTAAFVVVLAWKSLMGFREADVVILDPQEDRQAAEQRQIIGKMQMLTAWAKRLGFSAAALTVLVGALWVYRSLNSLYGV